jgi:hypothetical protein
VWWEYATKTIKASNTLPTTLQEEDYLLFLNKGGVGAVVPMTDVLDGSLIVPQSIFANAIAADQIDATHIKAGAVDADAIAAGAITTEKLTVGSVGDNLVTNGSFEEFANGVPLGWTGSVEAGTGTYDVVSGQSSSGAYAARLILPNATSGSRLSQSDDKVIPVSSASGRSWYLSARIGASVAVTKGFYLQVRWLNATKGLISTGTAVSNVGVGTSWAVVEGRVTPPSTARYMRVTVVCTLPNVATNVYIDEVTAREVVVGAVIADDAITAAHIQADAIDAMTIRGATIIGTDIATSDTLNAIAARMGPTAAKNPTNGQLTAGIGFQKVGFQEGAPAGMFSHDGQSVGLTQSQPSGSIGGATMYLGSTKGKTDYISIDGYNGVELNSANGAVKIQGTEMVSKHVEFTNGAGFYVSGGNQNWDIGPLVVDTAKSTPNYATVAAPGPLPGSVKVLEAGYYQFSTYGAPRSSPGQSMLRIYHQNGINLAQYASTGYYWELAGTTPVVYLAANEYVRFQVNVANAINIDSRVWVHKMPF